MILLPILMAVAAPPRVQQGSVQPAVGDIFDISPGEKFRGWTLRASGAATGNQSYAVFERGGRLLLALTNPLRHGAAGGIEVEKITHIRVVLRLAGEEVLDGHDCSFLGMIPIVSIYNQRTRTARGIFAEPNGFAERRWLVDDPELCIYSGD